MNSNVLFFDVETRIRPDIYDRALEWAYDRTDRWDTAVALETADREEQALKLAGTTPEFLEIIGLSVAKNDELPRSAWVGEINEEGREYNERFLIESFWRINESKPTLVSFNGSSFDLPVLLHRSAILGIVPSRQLFDIKPWDLNTHIDIFWQRWPKMHRGRLGLKDLGKSLNLPLPGGLSVQTVLKAHEESGLTGDNLEPLYKSHLKGDKEALSELKAYGKVDIYLTRELARLWGAYFFPTLVRSWNELDIPYDYQNGQWLDRCPPGFE